MASNKNTSYKVHVQRNTDAEIADVNIEQGAMMVSDTGLYMGYNGENVRVYPQVGAEFRNYLVPLNITVAADETVNLSDVGYDLANLIRLTYNSTGGGNQDMTLNLPDATLPINVNRVIRFLSNGGFSSNTKANLTPINGQTLDGSTSPYIINKHYEGIQVWSDGVEWFIIQKKA